MINSVKQYLNSFWSGFCRPFVILSHFIPTRLPQGKTAFTEWADDILNTYGLPNNDSTHFALATMVMHLGPSQCFRPKIFFALKCWTAASKEIAHAVMQELKEKQQAALKAANEKKE